jgi:hypothetical protein
MPLSACCTAPACLSRGTRALGVQLLDRGLVREYHAHQYVRLHDQNGLGHQPRIAGGLVLLPDPTATPIFNE